MKKPSQDFLNPKGRTSGATLTFTNDRQLFTVSKIVHPSVTPVTICKFYYLEGREYFKEDQSPMDPLVHNGQHKNTAPENPRLISIR